MSDLSFSPLSPAIGVLVAGVDLRQPLPPAVAAKLYELFNQHAILLVRGQILTEPILGSAAAWLGPLARRGRPSSVLREDNPFITKVSNIRENGRLIGSLPDGELLFHADNSFKEIPNRASFLYAVEIPSVGGNTLFANLYKAYDLLPARLKERIAGMKATQFYDYSTFEKEERKAGISNSRHASHPLVFNHPHTKRNVLYCNRLMTKSIEGLPADESRSLLDELLTYAEHPCVVYEHRWRPGDFLAWDNLSSNHARTDFSTSERRLLLRGTTKGDYRPQAA